MAAYRLEALMASTSSCSLTPNRSIRIFLYKKFLTEEECDELMKKAEPRLRRSGVSDSITGEVSEVMRFIQITS